MLNLLNIRSEAEKAAARIPDIKQDALRTAFHILHGHNPQRKAGSGEAFWQFREYQPGDLPREIDWRQSGKTDRVYIRQTEKHTAQTCLFWCKRNADMEFQSDRSKFSKQQASAIIALTLALLHSQSGDMIGVLNEQRPGHSEKALDQFEDLLMLETTQALPDESNIPRHARFYGLSDLWETPEDIEQAFAPIARRTSNGTLVQVLDRAELSLPYSGRVTFESRPSKDRFLIENVSDVREEYQQKIEAHRHALQELCKKWGWQYALHVTDTPYEDTVLSMWAEHSS